MNSIDFSKIFFHFKKGDWKEFIIILFALTFSSVFEILGISSVMPFIASLTSIEVVKENFVVEILMSNFDFTDFQLKLYLGFFSLLLLTMGSLSTIYANKAMLFYGNRVGKKVIVNLYSENLKKPYESFFDLTASELSKNINQETSRYTQNVFIPFLKMSSKIIFLTLVSILLLYISFIVTIITLMVIISLYSMIYFFVKKRLMNNGVSISKSNRERYRILNESISGIKETKILKLEKKYSNNFEEYSNDIAIATASSQTIGAIPKNIIELVLFGVMIIIVLVLTFNGMVESSLPYLTLFVFAGYKALPAVQIIYNSLVLIRSNINSIDSINIRNGSVNKIFDTLTSSTPSTISFSNVSFSYNDNIILKDVSFSLKCGDIIGIIGKSGSGKTTLIDLISGLLTPKNGEILCDDKRIDLMSFCAYVPQEVHLVEGTIRDNILLSNDNDTEIDKEHLNACIDMSGLRSFLQNKNQGLDTIVGENGYGLSGGQKQRIGIARALYQKKPLLILDEATSALDPESKKVFWNSFSEISKTSIVISVTHDMDALKYVNKVFRVVDRTISIEVN